MSNTQVGTIYSQIIQDVIESSRVDFEEGGVDDVVLEELKRGWQSKLSQLNVANFPWDPKPDPAPIVNPPTVPSNANNYQHGIPPVNQSHLQAQGPPQGLSMPQMNNQGNGPRIKTEPGTDTYTNQILPPSATTAQQRAAQHLQNNYGQRAAASINAIQGGGQQLNGQQGPTMQQLQQMQMMQQHRATQGQQPNQGQSQTQNPPGGMTQQQQYQYRQQLAAAQARQQAQHAQQAQQGGANGQNGVGGAQTDGAGDEIESFGIIKCSGPGGEDIPMGRIEIDGMIREKIEAVGRSMEGGGLMLPLHKASTPSHRKRELNKTASKLQLDGADDDDVKDEDLDEDAINSDLDDPDDGLNEEDDEDEGMGHIMLCMYDKVQRVKNKWKCVMKDGVLTVNGKEYVFHKATGEYEW